MLHYAVGIIHDGEYKERQIFNVSSFLHPVILHGFEVTKIFWQSVWLLLSSAAAPPA